MKWYCFCISVSHVLFVSTSLKLNGHRVIHEQGECWFQLRSSPLNPKKGVLDLNPGGILKERMRTLEETASRMARAVVKKGNQASINRHPDYEFFCSRKRW